MPAERFYIDADLTDEVCMTGAELHHLTHVMRVRVDEEVELVNGRGSLATARVTSISKKDARLEILDAKLTHVPLSKIILAIPLMRPSKLELIIEKGTELGADGFYLYPAKHSDKGSMSDNQLERLQHIAISAMKQCGRLDLPPIKLFDKLDEIFNDSAIYLFGDTKTETNKTVQPDKPIIFITGPEKGFTEKELILLNQHATGVRLHKNILRSETAPIAALCFYQRP